MDKVLTFIFIAIGVVLRARAQVYKGKADVMCTQPLSWARSRDFSLKVALDTNLKRLLNVMHAFGCAQVNTGRVALFSAYFGVVRKV